MKLISREELRQKLERADDVKLVMTLSAFAHASKRIPTSLHFDTVGEALAVLDPDDEIVVYCGDVHCAASIYAYRLLEREGYTRVRRYAGGIADWEAAGYPLEGGSVTREPARPRRQRPQPRPRISRPWLVCA